ncbi:MAG: membrane protein insertase YidC [Clostridia bacterium]|nr:membrane protein insertase YidC [Clostridia bacterium]
MSTLINMLGAPLGHVMRWCYGLTGSYGPAILLFTLITKVLLLPLGIWVHKNSIRVVRLQPELNRVKARFFGDRDQIAEEQSRLYKKEGYHPLLSLVPLFIQIVLLMGLVQVIYHPFDHLLRLDAETSRLFTDLTCTLTGANPESGSLQLQAVSAVHSGLYADQFAALKRPEALKAAMDLKTSFLGVDLGTVPVQAGGIMWLMPLLAGLSAFLLCVEQNRFNVLQSEQGKLNKYGTMAFSVGLSLYLGAFVPAGVALYWMASNLLAILQLHILNRVISPRRYVDYKALEESKKELSALQSVGGERTREQKAREKADYKRFFSVANKHLVFYSEGSGFYKYFEKLIAELLRRSNVVIHYVTGDPDDQIFDIARDNPRIQPYYIGDKKLITLFMKMDADVVVMTMSDLDNYHYKRSYVRRDITYIYMFHYPLSTHMVLHIGALDHYDTILCVGEFQFEEIRAAEKLHGTPEKKLIACGYGQLENLYEAWQKMDPAPRERPRVLIAPSWQNDNILDTCIDDMLNCILGHGYQVTVRPHPEYVKRYRARWDALTARWRDYAGDDLAFEGNFKGNESIYSSDVVISDWSGTAYEFDFVTLRPCVFIDTPPKINNPDYNKLGVEPLELSLRSRVGVSVDPSRVGTLREVLDRVLNEKDQYHDRILALREQYIANFGSSGKAAYRAVMDAIKEHGKKQSQ